MNLTAFTAQLSSIINIGAEADSYIPSAIRQGARWIERNYTLRYMRRIEGLTLGASLRLLDLGSNVKAVYSVDVRDFTSGEYLAQLFRDDYENIKKTSDAGLPAFFDYLPLAAPGNTTPGDEAQVLAFDRPTDKQYALELTIVRYTDPWPTNGNSNHWLIDNAEDLLTAQAIFYLAPFIRDADLMAGYKLIKEEAISTLLTAELENIETPSRQNRVGYGGSNG